MSNLWTRYMNGADVRSFSRIEAGELYHELMERGRDVYTNVRHPQHESLSRDVSALAEIAFPGSIGPGGETVLPPTGGNVLTRGAR